MVYQKLKTLCAIALLLPIVLNAQETSLTQFKTTLSIGTPPAIFTTSFDDKVAERIKSSTKVDEENREDYAKYSNYALNNLLKSGFVLYGDPMTKYVEKVAANLLKNEPGLRRRLQFYVLKTNTTNALCTEPGIIFITTGLISQIENEAQLAYIIAHEIVHYQEKHLQKSFTKSKESELNPTTSYDDLVLLSKDHEFEADKDALKLYHAAGYSDKEVNTVFDVLMYSYLTFDEVDVDSTFFGNPEIYIPRSYFPDRPNPILAFEDYDDSKSSHPNIRKRKDAIADEIKKYSDWKNNTSFLNEEEFKTIQNIARFESVRENLLVSNYIKALYEIYILEKEFPNNEYLQTSKAVAWATINQLSLNGKKRGLTEDMAEKEGAISILFGLFSNLNQIELALLSLRQIEDVYKQFPSSKRVEEIRNEAIGNLAGLRNLKIDDLESVSYRAAQRYNNKIDSVSSTPKIDSTLFKDETKYDRIRRIREQQSSERGTTTELTDDNFSLFFLYDLAKSGEFHEIYNAEKEKYTRSKVIRYSYNEVNEEDNNLSKSDLILITPRLVAETKGEFDLDATLLFYEYLNGGIEKHAPKDRLKSKDISLTAEFTTEKYNEAALINSFLIQTANLKNNNVKNLWVDYDEMNSLMSQYNDPYLLLISGKYYFDKFSSKAVTGDAKYIHIATGEIYSSRAYDSRYKLNKLSVEGLTHLVFSKFN
jgi:hypothetical protein